MTVDWKVYVDTLHDGLEKALAAKDLRDEQRFQGQGEALAQALTTVNQAVSEAKITQGAEMKSLSDKIDQLSTRAGGSVPRGEMEALLTTVGSRAETEISDAVASMTSRFSGDISRLTAAIESQSKMWGNEFGVLNTKVAALDESITAQRSKIAGATLTGKTLVTIAGAILTLLLIATTAYNFWPKK
jgi:type VI protein secretion system component VasK